MENSDEFQDDEFDNTNSNKSTGRVLQDSTNKEENETNDIKDNLNENLDGKENNDDEKNIENEENIDKNELDQPPQQSEDHQQEDKEQKEQENQPQQQKQDEEPQQQDEEQKEQPQDEEEQKEEAIEEQEQPEAYKPESDEESDEDQEIQDQENDEQNSVQDFIQVLEEHRKNCEKQGKYVEAEIAKNRLEELRLHEENRRREQMRSRQIAETLGVEEAHMMEYQEFNVEWDKKMADYEQHSKELLQEMKERHETELQDFQENLIAKQPKPKFSSELLNLRRVQDVLAKQKDYAEAHKIKLKADSLEAWEVEKWKNKTQTEMYRKEGKFKQKQDQELKALHMRIQAGREEQKKRRQLDLEKLLLRYQNVKSALEIQHTQEKMRFDRTARMNSTT